MVMSGSEPLTDPLRILTFNLLSPDHADWPRRRAVIRNGLDQLRPDIVALQETVWGRGYDQRAICWDPITRSSGTPPAPPTE
jgi:endonuclease/exonuclease/phosphatase family metal-dependent hydrolase